MKIIKILQNNRCSLSFEVFPPKASTSFEQVKPAIEKIAKLKPAFMSVTYGAGGGTSQYTMDIARDMRNRYGFPTMAHLTCVSSTKETVAQKIEDLKQADIQNVMALRGDLTPEMKLDDARHWDYSHAIDLIRELRESNADFCIGCACYPEVHPESPHQKEDIKYLKEKVDAGCDFMTTQMFFDNNLLYNFLYKIREAGITVPVLPGIIPQRFKALVDRFGNDDRAMAQAGIAYATDQIIDLYANGIQNVHLYTMNKPEVARAIQNNLSSILGK